MTQNVFMPSQGTPSRVVVGDFWSWRLDDMFTAYPPSSFALSYSIAPKSGGASVNVDAVSDSGGWLVSMASADTSLFLSGQYVWTLFAIRNSDGARGSLCTGTLTVIPDPSAGADSRSHARKMLDAINAVLEKRVTKDVEAYTIEGRSLTRIPFVELRDMRARLMHEVANEDNVARGRRGGLRITKVRL